jgi:hypothetical protein
MPLILRQNTGNDPLTYEQLDGNFEYFTGSHAITGSLVVSEGITGSLLGTASTASFVTLAQTASYVTTAQTASLAQTASFVANAQTASFVTLAQTASYIDPTFISASAAASGFSNTTDLGSLATTGSNVFVGNQTISGSINFGSGSTIQSTGSTLELTPDFSLGTDQYIVLDPTSPNHIHVRAGGVIDESSADLYLGGEKANVIVRNLDNGFNEKYWVQINSQTGSTQSTWEFDDNGNTLFPTLTTPRGDVNSGNLTTNTLKLGDGTNEAVISTPDGTAGFSNSQRLVINPGQGSGSSEGGDIYLWAGRGGVEGGTGGDVKVRGGYGPASGSGGYVRIEGGDTTHGTAGFVEIRGGNSTTETGGDVYIYGGQGNTNAQNGEVTINTFDSIGSQKSWVFDIDGNLSTPGNITADSFTGSLEGTASYATYAENAATASYYDGTIYISQVNPDQKCSLLFTSLNSSDYGYPLFDTTPTLTYNPNGATGILSLTGSMLINALGNQIIMSNLPTSEPATPGELWLSGSTNNSKFLCVRS